MEVVNDKAKIKQILAINSCILGEQLEGIIRNHWFTIDFR